MVHQEENKTEEIIDLGAVTIETRGTDPEGAQDTDSHFAEAISVD